MVMRTLTTHNLCLLTMFVFHKISPSLAWSLASRIRITATSNKQEMIHSLVKQPRGMLLPHIIMLPDSCGPSYHRSTNSRLVICRSMSESTNNNENDYNIGEEELLSPLLSSSSSSSSSSSTTTTSTTTKTHEFQVGDKIQVEVTDFGPLGASVEVIGTNHNPDDIIGVDEPPLGYGLVSQQEIRYFRQGRGDVDVVRGEILFAWVQRVRPQDGKLSIGLRSFGGKAKATEVGDLILQKLQSSSNNGKLPIGDKSSPDEINFVLPGVSKAAFKKAVGALYRKGLVTPSATSISLMANNNKENDDDN